MQANQVHFTAALRLWISTTEKKKLKSKTKKQNTPPFTTNRVNSIHANRVSALHWDSLSVVIYGRKIEHLWRNPYAIESDSWTNLWVNNGRWAARSLYGCTIKTWDRMCRGWVARSLYGCIMKTWDRKCRFFTLSLNEDVALTTADVRHKWVWLKLYHSYCYSLQYCCFF